MSEARPRHAIAAVQLDDVPEISQLTSDAFVQDRQTQMKRLGPGGYDMKRVVADSLPDLLRNPRAFAVKATDEATGDIMGYCSWGTRGLEPDDLPALQDKPGPGGTGTRKAGEEAEKNQQQQQQQQQQGEEEEKQQQEKKDKDHHDCMAARDGPLARLDALTGQDLSAWMDEIMPSGTRCLYVVSLCVSPRYQGRGVGSALLQWGTSICDQKDLFAWVHSSEPAWEMYDRNGFRTIRSLDVDLDEYATGPPPDEGPGAKWGHYVFRYMKYLPRRRQTVVS